MTPEAILERLGQLADSGRPAADEPDCRGDQQRREREQPAALDPLECPEPAGRLVAGPVRIAVSGHALSMKDSLDLPGGLPRGGQTIGVD